jgi:hypothetical protein
MTANGNIIEQLALVELRMERLQASLARPVLPQQRTELERTLRLLDESRQLLSDRLA